MLAEFPWEGHWEVWEREWVSARWVWDVRASRVGVSNRQRVEPELSQAQVAAADTTQAPAKTPIKAARKPFSRPAIPCCDTRTESEMLAEFPWEGHWEVWEREWGSARWVWDVRASRVGVSNRQRVEPELTQAQVAAADTTQAPAKTPIKAARKPPTMTAGA